MMLNIRLLTSAFAIVFAGLMYAQEAQRIEYFFDSDPGHGKATIITAKTGDNSINVPVSHLKEGAHLLCFRSLDSNGIWSTTYTRPVLVLSDKASETAKIECFFDSDPGYGKGHAFGAESGVNEIGIKVDTLDAGTHMLCLRSQDTEGRWSATYSTVVMVLAAKPSGLEYMEYFFDTDPGYGNGTAVEGAKEGEGAYMLSLNGLSAGAHNINLRAKDNQGNWSSVWNRAFYVYSLQNITRVEYFIDNDPGEGNATAVALPSPNASEYELAFDVSLGDISLGNHELCVRAQDRFGKWSLVSVEPFTVTDANGITEVAWTQQIGVEISEGQCNLVRQDTSDSDCTVQIVTVSGLIVAEADWAAGSTNLTLPVTVTKGKVVLVVVTNNTNGLRTVKRVMIK